MLDSFGVGALPNAAQYGDVGANTLRHIDEAVGGLHFPNMERLGLGKIIPTLGLRNDTPALGPMAKQGNALPVKIRL